MISLWIAAAVATSLAIGLMALFAARPVPVAADPARAVYRRQLTEIDDLAERGLLGAEERASAHAEAARRLIGEADPDEEQPSPPGAKSFVWGVGLLAGVLAVSAYLWVGHPGLPDQPYAQRLAAWRQTAETQPEALEARQVVALLEEIKKERGGDPQFLTYLAEMQNRVGNPLAAQRYLERAAQLAPDRAEIWGELGLVQLDLNEGKMSPRARASFEKALAIDPKAIAPRFFLADDQIKRGETAAGIAALRAMLPELSPEQQTEVSARIAEAERGGPAVNAAAADPAIQAMVARLAERLKTNPNDPEGWARLVTSYRVMGDAAKMNEALTDARRYFNGRPRELQAIEDAARGAAP
jgi:cytochrome c-type biogenesis protein CcmH